jgi:hypothetical protein
LTPALRDLPTDAYYALVNPQCDREHGIKVCHLTTPHATSRIVLFGDSHAMMWVSAVAPFAAAHHAELDVVSFPGCPIASVTVQYAACDTWRPAALARIAAWHPQMIILAERSSELLSAQRELLSPTAFDQGLRRSLAQLARDGAHLVMLGDNPAFSGPGVWLAGACLSIHATHLGDCAIYPATQSAMWRTRATTEAADIARVHGLFVDTSTWLCVASTCPPVVHGLIVYLDWSHITATYAYYLSGVMGRALRPAL